jgi:hypothetical protein
MILMSKKGLWLLACAALLNIACGGDGEREYVQAYESLVLRFEHAVANLNQRLDAARREGFPEDSQAKHALLVQIAADDAADIRKLHEQAIAIDAPASFVPVHSAMVAYIDCLAKGMEGMVQTFRSGRAQTESEMEQAAAPLQPLGEKWTKEAKNAGVLLPSYGQNKPLR